MVTDDRLLLRGDLKSILGERTPLGPVSQAG